MLVMPLHYQIEYIPGDHNVWADLLTRWGAPYDEATWLKALKIIPEELVRSITENFIWPTEDEIRKIQLRWLATDQNFLILYLRDVTHNIL